MDCCCGYHNWEEEERIKEEKAGEKSYDLIYDSDNGPFYKESLSDTSDDESDSDTDLSE